MKIFSGLLKLLIGVLFLIFITLCFSFRSEISSEKIKEKYCDAESKFAEVLGIPLHYKIEGKGDTLVLIHGTAASLHTWDDWTEILKDQFTIVRFDLPAFGVTGAAKNNSYTVQDYLNHVDGLLQQLSINKFHIAGNSLGGRIAWNYANSYPEKVKSLILLDASGYPIDKAPFVIKLAKTPILNKIIKYCTPSFFIEKNLNEVYYKDDLITDQLVERYYELSRKEGNRQAFLDRVESIVEARSKQIKDVRQPTLVIWGEYDEWIPLECAHKFDQDIQDSELKIIENSGHVPMEEDPETTAKIAADFILQH